jgi:hypothetical protein
MPQLEDKAGPRLFISYSHDSAQHEDRVLALANRLRHDGIDALIDQYDTAPPDGWPMWMDREIQKADFVAMVCTETYLRRVEGRELPGKGRGVLWEAKLIYNSLYPEDFKVQKFIPILFDGGQASHIPLPIRWSAHYRVDSAEGYEDFYRHLIGQPRHEKPALGTLKALPAVAPQSYPASLEISTEQKPSTTLDRRNRLKMLKRVRIDWVDGVLKESLYQIARIEFGLQMKSDAVEQPLRTIVQTPDRPPATVPIGVSIGDLFDDHAGALLILGAPGTGKTTLLLELAQELLDRAERDESHPIPVVFNLSSWAVRRQTLDRWLVDELNERSDVPKRLARQWVETEQVLPLLDGLDEVAVEHRQACAEAINNFRRDHGLLQIAVCSRIADYESLGIKLRLRTAVVVQPLTAFEVQGYLERIGEPARAVRAALKEDSFFSELLETPLMLWVAMLAYRDAPVELSIEDTFEQRRRGLFANFIIAMFKRRSAETRYTRRQTLSWLCWLARELIRNEQTVFYLENLSEEWLPTRRERWLSKAGIILACVVMGELFIGPTKGLFYGVLGGLAFGIIGIGTKFRPDVRLRFGFAGARRRVATAMWEGLIFGLLILVFGQMRMGHDMSLLLTCVLFVGLGIGLLRLATTEAVESSRTPNQGTIDSIKNALFGLLIGGLLDVLIGVLLLGWRRGLLYGLIGGLYLGLVGGPDFETTPGKGAGYLGGGLFVIRHWVLRLVLWIRGSAPLNYVRFLDYATERLFLRKVGGGYIFLHRMLLEYFATLEEPSGRPD